jgi:septum formation protein
VRKSDIWVFLLLDFVKVERIVLASASPTRFDLLKGVVGLVPEVMIPDINEDPLRRELPRLYVERLSEEKSSKVLQNLDSGYVISADTAVVLGRTILPKAINDELVKHCLEKISGRRHRVYTGICVTLKQSNATLTRQTRVVMSVVQFKNLTSKEIDWYVASGEGIGKAGGYSIQGLAQCFIPFLRGSVSNIMGLPMFELKNMLFSLGYKL